ncbi:MAG TPA: putative inorganic carbon transporter subunit DabA, partial [Enhygromyxa sp.]|nr:putative inorganic carbon transporter subunit DabA [Enhygromyxa sp.]
AGPRGAGQAGRLSGRASAARALGLRGLGQDRLALAQLCGLDGAAVASLDGEQLGALERELFEFDNLARRELLHLAYERHLRQRYYDAVLQHEPTPTPSEPLFQAIFCLDDREESIRRHLEELEPRCETFGLAGFYGVAMYFRGAEDAHPRPLCPVVITPQHYVAERLLEADSARARLRAWRRRGLGLVDKNIHLGSHTMVRGAILMAVLGTLSLIPLVLRVVFPWLENRVAKLGAESPTRLELDREPGEPPIGRFAGFTTDEKVAIVRAQLDNIGLRRMAPLVFSLGHGSFSLNNPHASAYDCGACAGGRGGPNGRAFAQMANDPEVRAQLVALGRPIPEGTWFVGGFRNSTDSSLTFYDLDRVPESHRAALEQALKLFEHARRRDAHERCRRFELARLGWSSQAALRHVESRAADMAQPRAECGHATNALCFVGRRARLRGLFLDRRCFLSSYDPTADDDGRILAGVLNAVVPVVAGINLEYYFSYVDPRRYGSGTKLPHNVNGLLGVMDGAQSDLRTGLPWQMVEIHEPVRTSLMVECTPELLARVIAESPTLTRLVEHRWVYLACLDPREGPASRRVWEHGPDGFTEQTAERALATVRGNSRTVYQGKRGHLPFTRILPSEPEVRRT